MRVFNETGNLTETGKKFGIWHGSVSRIIRKMGLTPGKNGAKKGRPSPLKGRPSPHKGLKYESTIQREAAILEAYYVNPGDEWEIIQSRVAERGYTLPINTIRQIIGEHLIIICRETPDCPYKALLPENKEQKVT